MSEPQRKQIIDGMISDLEKLPGERLKEVRDFVEFLRRKTATPRRGSPDALLRSFASWEGAPGELDGLVAEIYESRHQEE
ncbi:MAG: DUF2281 domain-containing protein [Chloroflexota bacterium]|nr:MAG: DUF2281 domain-containing protein [Chloroflexota bacterium]